MNGADKVCVFKTDSKESLPSLLAKELEGADLSGMAVDLKSNYLWLAGANLIARLDLSHSPPTILETTKIAEKFGLHPKGIAVDPNNGAAPTEHCFWTQPSIL